MSKKKPPQKSSLNNANNYTSTHDDIQLFQTKVNEIGWQSKPIAPDSGICRGQTKRDSHLWAVPYTLPVVAGAYGSWQTGENYTFCARSHKNLSPAELKALKQQWYELKQKQREDAAKLKKQAQSKANFIINNSMAAPDSFQYLKAKQVKAHNALLYQSALIIPLRDVHGVLHSIQFIHSDGSKRFQKGARTKAVFYCFGKIDPAGVLYIAEGWATAATMFEWKNKPTLAALNAGNLLPVALEVKRMYPSISFVFAADNDRFNKLGNIGKEKAEYCARIVGGSVLLPKFSMGSTGTDWNDLYVENSGVLA